MTSSVLVPPSTGVIPGVTQTILFDPDLQATGVYGNCLQAAVATVLDLPLDSVPHFVQFLWWTGALELWARGRGLHVRSEQLDGIIRVPEKLCVLSGPSPRGVPHSVVCEGGRVVWDPHPSRAGLIGVTDAMFFEPWDHAAPEQSGCPLCGPPRLA